MPHDPQRLLRLTASLTGPAVAHATLLTTLDEVVEIRSRGRSNPKPEHTSREHAVLCLWAPDGRSSRVEGPLQAIDTLVDRAKHALLDTSEPTWIEPTALFTRANSHAGIDDPRHIQIADSDRIEILTTNERAATREDKRVKATEFCWRDTRTLRTWVSSLGAIAVEPSTRYELEAEVTLRSNDEALTLQDHAASRSFATLACLPWGLSLAKRAVALDAPQVQIDGEIRVLLPSRPLARLLDWIAQRLDDAFVTEHGSFLTDHGGVHWDPRFHLLDDASLAGGLRTHIFDDRGVSPKPLPLFQEGRPTGRYLTPERARIYGHTPTGHSHGLANRPSNLIFNGGLRTTNALLSEYGMEVFEIDDFEDLRGIDAQTGLIDLPVRGILRRPGALVGAVRRARLQGNLHTAFQNLAGMASDTDRIGHVDAASIFVNGLRVVGDHTRLT